MKHCPSCKINYSDDTMEFCLEDGTRLSSLSGSQMPTVSFSEIEAQTVVRNPPPNPLRFEVPPQTTPNWAQNQTAQAQSPPKSNTTFAVLLTAIAMLALFGLGFGAWLYFGRETTEIAANTNSNGAVNQNNNANAKPTPTPTATANIVKATPTPAPDFNPEEVKAEVSDALNDWKSAAESLNLNTYMTSYADTVDYYNKRGASRSYVRTDRQRAFNMYDSININLSNMRVTPDASGERASVVLDKEWNFENSEKSSSGKVQQQMTLIKVNGKWLISGEKDLKVYYLDR